VAEHGTAYERILETLTTPWRVESGTEKPVDLLDGCPRLLIGSQGGDFHGGFAKPFHVANRRCAEEPLVLPCEV
jgi:hypothetical protein